MMKYKRLTLEEREKIHALVNQGKTNREISLVLNRSHTTISRELKRCGTKFEYSPSKAHSKARKEDPKRGQKKIPDSRFEALEEALKKIIARNSPEQVSKALKQEHPDDPKKWISHESIYKYIYTLFLEED